MILTTIRCTIFTLILALASVLSVHAAGPTEMKKTASGTVVETMDAADYTYMNVKTGGDSVWVALPATDIAIGEEVTYLVGMTMNNFKSNTLGRTFQRLIFSPGLAASASNAESSGSKTEGGSTSSFAEALKKEAEQSQTIQPEDQASPGSSGAAVPYTETEVEKASGENGYRIAELFEKAQELDGKTVRVKGRVVKVSPNIMGRNWIHIQDGTGDPMQNSHDLVATSSETVEVDDIVVAEGKVAADQDFGFGYEYDVLLEQTTFSE